MTTTKFSKREAVRFGWNTMKSNLGFFITLLIVVGLISFVPNMIGEWVKEDAPFLALTISFVFGIVSLVVQMGLIKIALRFCYNEKGELADLFSCTPLFFKYLVGSLLYGLIVFGGMILLIIPGIIWAIKFQFYDYLIIDKKLGPIEALKKSAVITKGAKRDLFVFGLLLGGINLLGVICLLIGLFAAIPTTLVAMAFVYRKLLAQVEIT